MTYLIENYGVLGLVGTWVIMFFFGLGVYTAFGGKS